LEACAARALPKESHALVAKIFQSLAAGRTLPREWFEEWAALALAEAGLPNDRHQLLAALDYWGSLPDSLIAAFHAADSEAVKSADPCLDDSWLSELTPLEQLVLGSYYLLEQDTEQIAQGLLAADIRTTRGALQSLINRGLKAAYATGAKQAKPGDAKAKPKFFMGPIAATDPELDGADAATLIRLIYHLASARECRAGGVVASLATPSGLQARVSEYARALSFAPISEKRRSHTSMPRAGPDRPPLPKELIPIIDGFNRLEPNTKRERVETVRRFFDPAQLPRHPDDGRPRQSDGAALNVDVANPSVCRALEKAYARSHLTRTELSALAGHKSTKLLLKHIEAHVPSCPDCQRSLELVTADSSVPARDLAAQQQGTEREMASDDQRLLESLGLSDSAENSLELEAAACAELRFKLWTIFDERLDLAEHAARELLGDVFDRWRVGDVERRPGPLGDEGAGRAKQLSLTARGAALEHLHTDIPEAAAGEGGLLLQVMGQGSASEYSLCIHEVELAGGWFTSICCAGSRVPARWGFRLKFRPEQELAAVAARGLTRCELGILRIVHGQDREHWRHFWDLLIRSRYGSDSDPVFAEVLANEGVAGRLPGVPLEVSFWVIEE
jgi:hypothetical protein